MTANRRRAFSLRAWLFALSFAVQLPLLLFAAYLVLDVQAQLRDRVLEELRSKTLNVAQLANERVDGAVVMLATLGASDSAQRSDWASLYWEAKRALKVNPSIRAVTLVNANGRLLLHTSMRFGESLFQANQPEKVKEVFRTGKPNVSGAFVAPLSSRSVVAVSAPVFQGGQVTHVMRAIILTDTINDLLTHSGLPGAWVAGIADRNGILLARTHRPHDFIGKPVSDSFIHDIKNPHAGPVEGITVEGIHTTRLVHPIFGGDWYVGIGVPTASLNEPMNVAITQMLLLGVLWMAVSLALSQWFAKSLSDQARALANAIATPATAPGVDRPTSVHEFNAFIEQVASERQLHTETSGRLNEAIDQRDVVTDIYNNAPCGYHSLDREGRISQINNTELRWLGRSRDDVLGRPYSDFVSDASRSEFATRFAQFVAQGTINDVELELVRKDGTTLLVLLNATSIREGNAHLMSRSTVFDITERKKLEVQLDQLARSDPLTGLSNRRDFYEKAQHELAMARRFQTPLALLMLDIDHFKRVNDSHGHDGGDAVLQALSRILRQVLRETDITARFGGEEFVVLIPGTDGPGALEAAERLRTTVAETRVALPNSAVVQLTVSIGLATLQETDTTIDQLLKRADLGAYTAKRDGRNRVRAREHLAAG